MMWALSMMLLVAASTPASAQRPHRARAALGFHERASTCHDGATIDAATGTVPAVAPLAGASPSFVEAHSARVEHDLMLFKPTLVGISPAAPARTPDLLARSAVKRKIRFFVPAEGGDALEVRRDRDRLVLFRGAQSQGAAVTIGLALFTATTILSALFLSLLGGIEMFGLIGVVLGPLMVAFFYRWCAFTSVTSDPRKDRTDPQLRVERRKRLSTYIEAHDARRKEQQETRRAPRYGRQSSGRARPDRSGALDPPRFHRSRGRRSGFRGARKADSVLSAARGRENDKLAAEASLPGVTAVLRAERDHEDLALSTERRVADAALTAERARKGLTRARLLAAEREETDLRLQIERTRADEALTSREDFLAMVSHDLRALLNGIVMSAGALKRLVGADPEGRAAQCAAVIERYSGRMDRLMGDLIDVARMQEGTLSVFPERTDVTMLVRELTRGMMEAATARGIELTSDVASEPLFAHVDAERIFQVLTNLVGNALKFTTKSGRVACASSGAVTRSCSPSRTPARASRRTSSKRSSSASFRRCDTIGVDWASASTFRGPSSKRTAARSGRRARLDAAAPSRSRCQPSKRVLTDDASMSEVDANAP